MKFEKNLYFFLYGIPIRKKRTPHLRYKNGLHFLGILYYKKNPWNSTCRIQFLATSYLNHTTYQYGKRDDLSYRYR